MACSPARSICTRRILYLTTKHGRSWWSTTSGSCGYGAGREAAIWMAHQSPATWPLDRKFPWPDRHFGQGCANPVPLATVSCKLRRLETPVWHRWLLWKVLARVDVTEHPVLTFADGVTRTIWLLTHGVTAMPVKCAMADAARLQALAGVDGGQPVAIGTLFKQKME